MTVALLFDSDDLTCTREKRKKLAEVRLDRRTSTMDEQQRHLARTSLAVDFVIHPESTDGCITLLNAHAFTVALAGQGAGATGTFRSHLPAFAAVLGSGLLA
jgi:hypothetical protein